MPPLPRGTCPVCRAEWALRKGNVLREHQERWPSSKICEGSGSVAVEYQQAQLPVDEVPA